MVPGHFKGFNREGLCKLATHGMESGNFAAGHTPETSVSDVTLKMRSSKESLAASEESESIQLFMSTP